MDEQHEQEGHPEELTLLDYVVGELGPDTSDRIRRHVETCSSCRERIVDLAMDMDEIDRLPLVAIPHDLLRAAFGEDQRLGARRRRRLVPFIIVTLIAIGIVALFQLGGMRATDTTSAQRQVVLQLDAGDPVAAVEEALGGIPHSVVVDRDDDRHLVVLVGDGDLAVAQARLVDAGATSGRSYVIELGGTGQLPATNG